MQAELREAARRVCKPEEIQGAEVLIGHLGKISFVQGLKCERIQKLFAVEASQSCYRRLWKYL